MPPISPNESPPRGACIDARCNTLGQFPCSFFVQCDSGQPLSFQSLCLCEHAYAAHSLLGQQEGDRGALRLSNCGGYVEVSSAPFSSRCTSYSLLAEPRWQDLCCMRAAQGGPRSLRSRPPQPQFKRTFIRRLSLAPRVRVRHFNMSLWYT